MKENEIYFLKRIHHYYPVGVPSLFYQYPGIKEIEQRVAEKIDQLAQPETAWVRYVKALSEKVGTLQIDDLGYLQFPSYQLKVKISTHSIPGLQVDRYLCLTISLLIEYYTLFFLEEISFSPSRSIFGISSTTYPNAYQDGKNDETQNIVKSINELVPIYFGHYNFADHISLFENKIRHTPVFGSPDIDDTKIYGSIYSLLFSNDLRYGDFVIFR